MSVIQIILGILVLFGSVALIAGTLMTNHRETRTIGGFAESNNSRAAAMRDTNERTLRKAITVVACVCGVLLTVMAIWGQGGCHEQKHEKGRTGRYQTYC